LSPEDLKRPDGDVEREVEALRFAHDAALRDAARDRALIDQRLASCRQELEEVLQSKSWRLTAPFRATVARVRRR
jgi:hypothetical protein